MRVFGLTLLLLCRYCDAVYDLFRERKGEADGASQKGSTKGDASARSHVSAKSTKSAKSQKADDGEALCMRHLFCSCGVVQVNWSWWSALTDARW